MSTSFQPLVLIIEDELPIRRFLSASLADSEYRVNEAASADERDVSRAILSRI